MLLISKHVLYPTWNAMIARCHNVSNADYKNYGARGIKVCDEWKNNFSKFLFDMGPRPVGYSIERKDNDLGYNPNNCSWATKSDQAKNQRRRSNAMSDQKIIEIFYSNAPVWFLCHKYVIDKKTVWEIKNFKYGVYATTVCNRYKLNENLHLVLK